MNATKFRYVLFFKSRSKLFLKIKKIYAFNKHDMAIFVPALKHAATNTYKGVEIKLHGLQPRRWMKVNDQLHASTSLSPEKYAPCALDIRLGMPDPVWISWRKEKSLLLKGIEPQ
jgi:hypothetical protein